MMSDRRRHRVPVVRRDVGDALNRTVEIHAIDLAVVRFDGVERSLGRDHAVPRSVRLEVAVWAVVRMRDRMGPNVRPRGLLNPVANTVSVTVPCFCPGPWPGFGPLPVASPAAVSRTSRTAANSAALTKRFIFSSPSLIAEQSRYARF